MASLTAGEGDGRSCWKLAPIDERPFKGLPVPEAAEAAPEPLRSVHSTTFPDILRGLGISAAVTTYQAGKLVLLRADEGKLNTHFRSFRRPMGLAVTRGRIAVGTGTEIRDFHDVPSVAARLEPAGKHDACFLPRSVHFAGDILVHNADYRIMPTGVRRVDARSDESRMDFAARCGIASR